MDAPTTVADALAQATARLRESSPTARLDSELLLATTLGWSRARILAESRAPLSPRILAEFNTLVERRAAREPVAYLVGRREFFGLELRVDRRVLVPRPETELLVERALAIARRFASPPADLRHDRPDASVAHPPLLIADIGTGSGCIAIALAANLPDAYVIATDISTDALEVARANCVRHGLTERIELRQGDLLEPLDQPVDLLVSNPPYTILSMIDEGVRRYEPALALDGGADGLALYRRLLMAAPMYLRPGGALLFEIGADQGAAVLQYARAAFPAAVVTIAQDLAGHDRVVIVES